MKNKLHSPTSSRHLWFRIVGRKYTGSVRGIRVLSLIIAGATFAAACGIWQATIPAHGQQPPTPAPKQRSPRADAVEAAGAPKAPEPVASQRADVSRVLQLLAKPGDRWCLSGQNVGHSNLEAESKYRNYIRGHGSRIGHTPSIVSVDYGWYEIPGSHRSTNRFLIEHARRGGLVTISMHPPNPWRNSDSHDTRVGDWSDLFTKGTAAYRQWHRDLDRVAEGLAELRDANVVVLWRPIHEMNGGWFWWCPHHKGRWIKPAAYRALWRDMFNYFTREKKLDNLLWVYSAAVQQDATEQKPAIYYYPGDKYVDVVGLSWYLNEIDELDRYGSYAQMVALGKPLGLNECGPQNKRDGSFDCDTLRAAFKRYDRLRYFVFWHSWPDADMAFTDIPSSTRLLSDPRVISLERIKELSGNDNPRSPTK